MHPNVVIQLTAVAFVKQDGQGYNATRHVRLVIGVLIAYVPVPALTTQQTAITSQAVCAPVAGQGTRAISRVVPHFGVPTVEKYATALSIIAYLATQKQVNAFVVRVLPESTARKCVRLVTLETIALKFVTLIAKRRGAIQIRVVVNAAMDLS